MGTGPKVALAVAAVAVAIVLLVVLRPGDEDDEAQPTTPATTVVTTTVTETNGETTTTTATTTAEEPDVLVRAEIVVEGGEVSGPKRVRLEEGQRLLLVVRADVVDHVHVHGYDLLRDVGPGQPARFSFRVSDPGRFDVELEDRHQLLIELVVSP